MSSCTFELTKAEQARRARHTASSGTTGGSGGSAVDGGLGGPILTVLEPLPVVVFWGVSEVVVVGGVGGENVLLGDLNLPHC